MGKPVVEEEYALHTMVKSVAILILAVAIVPFLAEWHTPFGGRDAGIAYAKGGGGGSPALPTQSGERRVSTVAVAGGD